MALYPDPRLMAILDYEYFGNVLMRTGDPNFIACATKWYQQPDKRADIMDDICANSNLESLLLHLRENLRWESGSGYFLPL